MDTTMDTLLRQWGQERAAPALEASVRSPLGDTDQWLGGGRSSGGERGLGVAAMFAQHSRACRVVDDVLRSLSAPREEGGLGGRGLTLYALAKVRYVQALRGRPARRAGDQRADVPHPGGRAAQGRGGAAGEAVAGGG